MADSFSQTIKLPEISCPFPVTYHKHGDEIAAASDHWFEHGCLDFTEDKRRRLNGLKAGRLTGYCYNTADDDRLRVVCDFMNFLFHLDDFSDRLKAKDTVVLSDVVMNAFASPHSYRRYLPDGRELPEDEPEASMLARDYWSRCIEDASLAVQARYCQHMEQYFESIKIQAVLRDSNSLPDIETYMIHRRHNSGCEPCFDLLEYTFGIEFPDSVVNDPILQTLAQCTNDFISLSNDIFSYNVEQSREDVYNIVVIVMQTYNMGLQAAINHVGEMCDAVLDRYLENKARLPSWGPQIDGNVRRYVQGLEDWISGSLRWSFESERYFGHKHEVKPNGLVELLTPMRVRTNAA